MKRQNPQLGAILTARHILGVKTSSTYTEIKQAFRKKAMELHPDRNPSPHAVEKFATVCRAYRLLMSYCSPFQRRRYANRKLQWLSLVKVER